MDIIGVYRHTEPVMIGGTAFYMHEPILYRIVYECDLPYVSVDDLDIAIPYSNDRVLEDELLSEVSFLLAEYGLEDDDGLTKDAIKLKGIINGYFIAIPSDRAEWNPGR